MLNMTCDNAISSAFAIAYVSVEVDLGIYLNIEMDAYVPAAVPLGELSIWHYVVKGSFPNDQLETNK